MSASIGVATYPEYGPTADEVLLAADRACFVAKRRGRDQIATAEEGLALAGELTLQAPTPLDPPQPDGADARHAPRPGADRLASRACSRRRRRGAPLALRLVALAATVGGLLAACALPGPSAGPAGSPTPSGPAAGASPDAAAGASSPSRPFRPTPTPAPTFASYTVRPATR